ncbi:MAG: UDP-glucose 4-epimerase GalE [Deltaproteobacteria bacterium]|nr:UDP-glucose 4-epimerase GalE [Deltaproteobacteria bacterium]
MNILICGGAGYIGSHMVKMLAGQGHQVTVFDNLSTGHKEAVFCGVELVQGDLLHPEDLAALFSRQHFDAVMHFSAKSLVGESVLNPALYYANNVVGTLNLLDAMRDHGVSQFIFSSSASIFGNPLQEKINESHPQAPINPYGETKLMVEHILRDYHTAYGLRSVSLRYFNAAGADPGGEIGESHQPETHLLPNVLCSLLLEQRALKVFGREYNTTDGTCVRDYIHINDLCEAHLLALSFLEENDGAHGFNLGNGNGFSVLEIIHSAEQVTGRKIAFTYAPPRSGDPATLVADSARAMEKLVWQPKYTKIDDIIATAWHWHQNQRF